PQGTFVTAYINGEHKLDPTKFTISGGQNYATVNFKSEIEAELWIDDKFVGNVPASIRLPEGEYQVAAYQPGYRRWIRKITVTAGSLMNLTVVLEKDEVKK
ncbi:MAG TPA: PEGA domain-containing protein, partial [Blastocatellia bacterium]|nr:PEGA domain-containing protein [Blastocatellia bacterium]